jgi:hypothetical protein
MSQKRSFTSGLSELASRAGTRLAVEQRRSNSVSDLATHAKQPGTAWNGVMVLTTPTRSGLGMAVRSATACVTSAACET